MNIEQLFLNIAAQASTRIVFSFARHNKVCGISSRIPNTLFCYLQFKYILIIVVSTHETFFGCWPVGTWLLFCVVIIFNHPTYYWRTSTPQHLQLQTIFHKKKFENLAIVFFYDRYRVCPGICRFYTYTTPIIDLLCNIYP